MPYFISLVSLNRQGTNELHQKPTRHFVIRDLLNTIFDNARKVNSEYVASHYRNEVSNVYKDLTNQMYAQPHTLFSVSALPVVPLFGIF